MEELVSDCCEDPLGPRYTQLVVPGRTAQRPARWAAGPAPAVAGAGPLGDTGPLRPLPSRVGGRSPVREATRGPVPRRAFGNDALSATTVTASPRTCRTQPAPSGSAAPSGAEEPRSPTGTPPESPTAATEAANNLIKRVKRVAFGIHQLHQLPHQSPCSTPASPTGHCSTPSLPLKSEAPVNLTRAE